RTTECVRPSRRHRQRRREDLVWSPGCCPGSSLPRCERLCRKLDPLRAPVVSVQLPLPFESLRAREGPTTCVAGPQFRLAGSPIGLGLSRELASRSPVVAQSSDRARSVGGFSCFEGLQAPRARY